MSKKLLSIYCIWMYFNMLVTTVHMVQVSFCASNYFSVKELVTAGGSEHIICVPVHKGNSNSTSHKFLNEYFCWLIIPSQPFLFFSHFSLYRRWKASMHVTTCVSGVSPNLSKDRKQFAELLNENKKREKKNLISPWIDFIIFLSCSRTLKQAGHSCHRGLHPNQSKLYWSISCMHNKSSAWRNCEWQILRKGDTVLISSTTSEVEEERGRKMNMVE